MKTYRNLWKNLISFENLELAYQKARKHKTNNPKVIEFDNHWRLNLCILLRELRNKTYKPIPLKKFVLRDPKTRIISVSDFRDRVVHHALVNILQPIFEPRFIFDSYASRKNKGTLPAINRFDKFKRKITKNGKLKPNAKSNNDVIGFVLKADIKKYFQTVDHKILTTIIGKRIKDSNVLWLIKSILENHESKVVGKDMPLGNWTSQFFANIYLNELDQYIKHELKIEYYIRYVDDFVILHTSKTKLKKYEGKIKNFLEQKLLLELHPEKCQITQLKRGVSLLGFRIFYHHKIPRKRNIRKIKNKLAHQIQKYKQNIISSEEVLNTLQGWSAYAMQANTYKLREKINSETINQLIGL